MMTILTLKSRLFETVSHILTNRLRIECARKMFRRTLIILFIKKCHVRVHGIISTEVFSETFVLFSSFRMVVKCKFHVCKCVGILM